MTHKVREFGVGFESPHAREFIALAKRAEEIGFGTFWVPEDPFYRGAFTLASGVACGTSTIEITRRLFRGEKLSYAGRVFQTERIKLSFKPTRAEVPIHLGVLSPKNLEL